MATILNKRVGDLEATYWVKAEAIELPIVTECLAYFKTMEPLGRVIFDAWGNQDDVFAKVEQRLQQIQKALPPIHPAFLPDTADGYRLYQWALYHRPDYRELLEKQWTRFLEYARSRYDVTDGGLLGVALRLYEKDIARWTAERDYIGSTLSREKMASEMIELQRIFERKLDEADNPDNEETRQALWQQALYENEFNIYGRQMNDADMELDKKMWVRVAADMAAGVPASESEAAAYSRDISARYPHK